MRRVPSRLMIFGIVCVMMSSTLFHATRPAFAQTPLPFADSAFQQVWEQADEPVASGQASRSWLWGPTPIGVAREYYAESTAPNQQRIVQYFDKTRMEITNPDGDPNATWYVTNGLLVKEMVSGQRQIGDAEFVPGRTVTVPVAGDTDGTDLAPGFSRFRDVATLDGSTNRSDDRSGLVVAQWMAQDGTVSEASPPATVTLSYYEDTLGHNIPDIFWNWMNDPANGVTTFGSWIFPMGLPLTEPYWITAPVGGAQKTILVQLFERRVLTYTPDNAPEWQVEMGNVGKAYLRWSEPPASFYPAWSPDSQQLAFSSTRVGNSDIYSINVDGTGLSQLTDSPYDEMFPQWLPNGSEIAFQRFPGYWLMSADGTNQVQMKLDSPVWSPDGAMIAYQGVDGIHLRAADGSTDQLLIGDVGLWFNIVWSPDSTKLAFVTDSWGPGWTVVATNVGNGTSKRVAPSEQDVDAGVFWTDVRIQNISWSHDGSRLAISRVPQGATVEGDLVIAQADGSGTELLEIGPVYDAQWSPVGEEIAFIGPDPDGEAFGRVVLVINSDGSGLRKVSFPLVSDWNPVWSPDGTMIATRRSPGDSREQIWIANADGSGDRLLVGSPPWP